jgi:hypothetical protein
MEYLTEDKHRYTAKILAENLVGNVESALLQAEKDLNSFFGNKVYTEYSEYYLIYDEKWVNPYVVKKSKYPGKINVDRDINVKRYKW